MNGTWKYLFRPVILSRGEDYYYGGNISHIRKTQTGWEAVAHGTNDYDVRIETDGNRVMSMYCSCPYAADGKHCKHMAALLYTLEENDCQEDAETGKSESIDEILEAMSREELRNELRTIIEENSTFRDRIRSRYRKTPANINDVRRIVQTLEMLEIEIGDRYGHIDWQNEWDYADAFKECLNVNLEPMLDSGEYMPVFEVLKEAFRILNQVEMDGSGGTYGNIALCMEDYWKRLISMASQSDRDKMYEWFTDMQSVGRYLICSESIDTILETCFNRDEYIERTLEIFRNKLNDDPESTGHLEILLEDFRHFLYENGLPLTEYEDWLSGHEDLKAVRKIRKQEEQNRKADYGAIADLVLKNKNETDPKIRKLRLIMLADLYAKVNDTVHVKSALKRIITEYPDNTMDQVRRLHRLCTEDEWPEILELIIKNNPDLKYDILFEEKMYDRLMEELRDKSAETAEPYRKTLQNLYPEELLQMYIHHLERLSEKGTNKEINDEIDLYLRRTAEIPGGTEEVRKIVDEWMIRYPKRKKMQEMLIQFRIEI